MFKGTSASAGIGIGKAVIVEEAELVITRNDTKTLHVEKCYAPDARSFTIEEYPDYSPLPGHIHLRKVQLQHHNP